MKESWGEGPGQVSFGLVSWKLVVERPSTVSREDGGVRGTLSALRTRKPHHRGGAGGLPHCCAVPGTVIQVQERVQGPCRAAVAVSGGESPLLSCAASVVSQLLFNHNIPSICLGARLAVVTLALPFVHVPPPLTQPVPGNFFSQRTYFHPFVSCQPSFSSFRKTASPCNVLCTS